MYIKQGKFGPLVAKANWIDVINKQQEEIQEPLHSLREWRNLLAHSYLPLVGTRDLPVWMRYGFLKGLKNLETCEAALTEVEKDRTYHAIFGLNEYLRTHGNKDDFHKASCGLTNVEIGDKDNLILQFSKDAPQNWKKILKKIKRDDLSKWTGLSMIDVR